MNIERQIHTIFLIFCLLPLYAEGQKEEGCPLHYKEDHPPSTLDSLETLYGKGKQIPEAYRASVLIALSGYPELKEVRIEFAEEAIHTTMAARPVLSSLLGDHKERRYRISIDTLAPESEGKLFHELPFQARIGIMAHELAHILDYEKKSPAGLLGYALRYLPEKGRNELECRTDRIAVERGFGWQLLAFKDHLKYCAELTRSYKEYKERIYLSYEELIDILKKDPRYSFFQENETESPPSTSKE